MTGQDFERLTGKLFSQRQEIFQELQNLNRGWNKRGAGETFSEERPQQADLDELFAQLNERGQREVGEIDLALTKIVNANYGICEDCRKSIPLERLLTLPATRYCLKCSDREEEKERRGDR